MIQLNSCYRLAPAAVLRRERFGGLIYRHDNRRLYFLHSPALVAFLEALERVEPLGTALDRFVAANALPPTARARFIQALTRLEQLEVLTRIERR